MQSQIFISTDTPSTSIIIHENVVFKEVSNIKGSITFKDVDKIKELLRYSKIDNDDVGSSHVKITLNPLLVFSKVKLKLVGSAKLIFPISFVLFTWNVFSGIYIFCELLFVYDATTLIKLELSLIKVGVSK